MAEEVVKILIVSHGRADRVMTLKHVAGCSLCVAEAQADQYRKHNPGIEIITHPDDVLGIGPKRQWVMDHFSNVFMIDDDCTGITRLWIKDPKEDMPWRVDPETVYDLIQVTASNARAVGTCLFGFNQVPRPEGLNTLKPILLTSFIIAGAFGILSPNNLWVNKKLVAVDDFWLNGLNAYLNRYSFKEMRFGFSFHETFASVGGTSEYRNLETEKVDTLTLRQTFGTAIQRKLKTAFREVRHKYERSLIIPW